MIINKNEKGITLIALIITIIVLLILAGISISMLMGKNGILDKASSAKEKTEIAQLIESAQTDIIGKQSDNNGSITKKDLKSVLDKYFLSVPDDLNNNTKLTATAKYGSYEVTLSDIYKGKIIENNITAKMISDNPSNYYGKKVTNYTSENGQNDWKIFYSDGTHIFLITGDYVDLSTDNKLDSNTGMTKKGTHYKTSWDNTPNFQSTNETVLNRFMATKYDLNANNTNANSKCVSTLLNANNWKSYKDTSGMADFAIGGSTIEMWVASWNNLYKDIDGQLFCNTTDYGYCIAENETNTDDFLSPVQMDSKKGYSNTLYYPHTSGVEDGSVKAYYYWIASPHIGSSNLLCIDCYGDVSGNVYNSNFAIRPVVSLNTSASVNITD